MSGVKRIGCGVVGVMALVMGLYFSHGAYGFSYRNWFGGLVFGPLMIVLGLVALLGSVFNWPTIWDSPPFDHPEKSGKNA